MSAGLPRVGVVSAWFDPEDPRVWSGVPYRVITEFRRLGVYAGRRDGTPWPPGARLLARGMTMVGRKPRALAKEIRTFSVVSDAMYRARTPSDVDAWVHLVGAYGPLVRTKYVTLFELSPSQLAGLGDRWASSLGYPDASASELTWAAARQEQAHRKAHAICMASRWAADSLVRDHGVDASKIHIVGYGPNTEFSAPEHRDWGTPRFLFIGWDWKRKNGDAVVRAFARLRREVPAARLDLVGIHPEPDVEGVTSHGPIAVFEPEGRAKIEALLAAATCFVVPSFLEPFGIVYVEAAAAGLASIGTTIGGTVDSIGEGGELVDPYDDDSIYAAMRRLSDPDTAKALGAIALQRSAAFTWPQTGQRVLRSLDLPPLPGVELAEFL